MQGVEQSTANIMYFSLAEKLYPGTGYYRETGGYLGNLRNSTNIAKVRAYHEQFYRSVSTISTLQYPLLRTGQPLRWPIISSVTFPLPVTFSSVLTNCVIFSSLPLSRTSPA